MAKGRRSSTRDYLLRTVTFDTGERLAANFSRDSGGGRIDYELPLDETWLVACSFRRRGEDLVLAELKVIPKTDAAADALHPLGWWSEQSNDVPVGGITATLLRAIPVGEIVKTVLGMLADEDIANDERIGVQDWLLPAEWRDLPAVKRIDRRGQRAPDNRYYAEWALRYVEKQATSHRPLVELAEESNLDREQVRDLVKQSRLKGLLTHPGPGRTASSLTPKAKELLEEMSRERRKGRKR